MKRWKELTKTILLNVLVILSFLLTFMLWNKQPKFEFISPATYVTSNQIGQAMEMEDLIMPEAIIFHYGNDKHTKATNRDAMYRIMRNQMAKWYFSDFTPVSLTRLKWEAIAQEKMGLEITYRSTVPVSVMNQLFTFHDEINEIQGIDRIWLYYEETEDTVFALFISNEEQRILRARTAVNVKDLRDSYLRLGATLPEQIAKVYEEEKEPVRYNNYAFWNVYYVPKGSIRMKQYHYNYLPITDQQLIQSFFLDPTLVKQVVERDDTTIFTDGSRSIQIRPNQQTLTFTNPALQQGDDQLTEDDKLQGVISFINVHLGWTDDYQLEQIEARSDGTEQYVFRQYLDSFPLISDAQTADVISVTSEKGHVVSLKRSLIDFDTHFYEKDWVLMSGHELFNLLRERHTDVGSIRNIYLAYHMKLKQGYVELIPSWVIQKATGKDLIIDARSQTQGGGRVNGLE